jgi:hypothetical protein
MPQAQNKDGPRDDLIPQLIVADNNPSDFTRFERFQLFPEARIIE